MASINPYDNLLKTIDIGGKTYKYFDLPSLGPQYDRLPFSVRVLLESCVRNCDNFQVLQKDVQNVLDWEKNQAVEGGVEIAFKPARIITNIVSLVDLAAMRDAVQELGGDPDKINPVCPSELVIDHSVEVDFARSPDALKKNEELEFERNKERFQFIKWSAQAFDNLLVLPSGSGIIHQVNLEYLARVVFTGAGDKLHPDSVVGTDSHTTMINGLGVLGWGVGGIEAEAVMLGQAISMLLPKVVGYRLVGELNPLATSTDLVLTITKHLRSQGVVGKFVEFFGPGVTALSIFGATVAYFPVDGRSLQYLAQTNRPKAKIEIIEAYLRAVKLFRDYDNPEQDPVYSEVVEFDLASVVTSVSGPKRPQDRVSVTDMKRDFQECLKNKVCTTNEFIE
ncbi:hypothetical protein ABMA27_012447, partial [Loxostege sticticalis]